MKPSRKVLLGALACGVVATGLVFRAFLPARAPPAEAFAHAGNSSLEPLWKVPPFSFVDQDGRGLTDQDLIGRVWIASFLFTSCTAACPALSSQLALLQRQLVDPNIRFVSFSVDPEHDTPAALNAYRARWTADPR